MTITRSPLHDLYDAVTEAGAGRGGLALNRPEDILQILQLPPLTECAVRDGQDWLELRDQYLGDGRTLMAVVARIDDNLTVTAYTDTQGGMHEHVRDLTQLILGRAQGTRIERMDAVDLVHRTVTNEHGAEFHISGLTFQAQTGTVWIELMHLDVDGQPIPHSDTAIPNIEGWTIR